MLFAASLLALVASASAATGPVVNFGNNTGAPKHLASGILYGLPDNATQIPSSLLSGFGFNYYRGSGARIGNGWSYNKASFEARFVSTHDNYLLTRQHGGGVIILLNDLWGFDGTQNSSALPPGANGDWTSYRQFINAIIQDIKKYKMQEGLIIDIWNEPDLSWSTGIPAYLEMWGIGWHMFRKAFGTTVLTSGLTTSGAPSVNSNWWTQWATFVIANNSIPDQYAWHLEYSGASVTNTFPGLIQLQQEYKLPARPVNVNEYATYNQQVPAGSAYFISQIERYDIIGLRGNWLVGTQLHDFAASLLGKPDPNNYASAGYYPNGDWWVYNYYVQNMTGYRVGTDVSTDVNMDAYATVGSDGYARVLMGVVPNVEGTYTVTFNNMTALGLPSEGVLPVDTWAFRVNSTDAHFGQQGAPTNLGYYNHTYSNNQVQLDYFATDTTSAYAWQFAINI